MARQDRRHFLKSLGATGATVTGMTLAGCGQGGTNGNGDGSGDGDDEGDGGQQVEEGLPEEDQVRDLVHLGFTEQYHVNRYRSVELVTERVSEALGVGYENDPVEVTQFEQREVNGEFDTTTYTWWSDQGGDPDNVFNFRFHTDGQRNFGGYSDPDYDESAEAYRTDYDLDTRQQHAFDMQEMLGELRWEIQYMFNVRINAYNTTRIKEDSIVVDPRLIGTWLTWTNLEPADENDDGTVATNNWDPTNNINPFHQLALGPSRNLGPIMLLHDPLIRYGEGYNRQLWVANEIEIVDDTTVVVKISDEFVFHDGEPLTASDVVWTYQTILDTEAPAHITSVVERLDSVEQTGDNEITFNLIEPYAPFTTLTFWRTPIVPQHVWEGYMADTGTEDAPWEISFDDDRPLIGSGPFQFGSWIRGERFRLDAFKDHPMAPPSIEARIQRPLAATEAEIEALRQGDYGYMDFWFGDNQTMVDAVEEHPDLGMHSQMDNLREAAWLNVREPPLSDVAFRQAIATVVQDIQPVMIEEIYDGFGEPANTPIPPIIKFWHNPDVPWFTGGDEAAREILSDAGYRWDPDGNVYYPEDS